MIAKYRFHQYGPDTILDKLGLKTLFAFVSLKALRGGPRLLPYITLAIVILLILTHLFPTRLSDIAFGSSYTKILKWAPSEDDDDSVGGGLRVVVFGGGDVASPSKMSQKSEIFDKSWTEVLCAELHECNTHLSFVPRIDVGGGPMVTNSLVKPILESLATANASAAPGLDYSWVAKQYSVISQLPDLGKQVQAFLAKPAPSRPPHETLWVFSFGYWEVWRLATLPRTLALAIIKAQVGSLFEKIEILYGKAGSEDSIAYSNYYTVLNQTVAPPSANTTAVVLDVQPEAFRIFIPSLFDISLTPGFETSRFKPPRPHTTAEETKNAVYLTEQWDRLVAENIDAWLKIPEPTLDDTTNKANYIEKRDASGNQVFVPNARREAITHDAASVYLKDVIVDRQLRNANIVDQKGLGTKPISEGYLDVSTPCMPLGLAQKLKETVPRDAPKNEPAPGVCALAHEHLFWTEFTVGQRAISNIGKSAAERYRKHVEKGVQWLRWWNELPSISSREFHA